MDWLTGKEPFLQAVKKYRYVVIVILVGVILMMLPEKSTPPPVQEDNIVQQKISIQESLGILLSKMEGAGNVEVLLTEKAGEEILYQMDEDKRKTDTSQEITQNTVLTENSQKLKSGMIRQIIPPQYQGAVVLAQGADSATVRLALVEAVMSATGLPSHNITVIKMK